MNNSQQWLRTPEAATALGCSQNHLKRCRDSHGGFLVGGEDYILGISHTAACDMLVRGPKGKQGPKKRLARAKR